MIDQATGNNVDLQALRITTAYLPWIEGLKLLPASILCFAVLVVERIGSAAWFLGLSLTAFAAAVVAGWMIGRYYNRILGAVVATTEQRRRRAALLIITILPVIVALETDLSGWPIRPDVTLVPIVFAAALLVYWLATGRRLTHYLVLAVVGAFATVGSYVAPLSGVSRFDQDLFYAGLVSAIAGWFDHRWLMKHLSVADPR